MDNTQDPNQAPQAPVSDPTTGVPGQTPVTPPPAGGVQTPPVSDPTTGVPGQTPVTPPPAGGVDGGVQTPPADPNANGGQNQVA